MKETSFFNLWTVEEKLYAFCATARAASSRLTHLSMMSGTSETTAYKE
jgi:hypothetical protein